MKTYSRAVWLFLGVALLSTHGEAATLPKRIDFTNKAGSCTALGIVRFAGNRIYVSTGGSKCGRTVVPANLEHGEDYPLNGSQTRTVKCTWRKGTKVNVCDNGKKIPSNTVLTTTITTTTTTKATSSFSGDVLTLDLDSTDVTAGQTSRFGARTVIRISGNTCKINYTISQAGKTTTSSALSCKVSY